MEIIVKKFHELTVYELYEILRLRSEIFVVEQTCVYQDLDNKDIHPDVYHMWLVEDEKIKAYIRVLERGISFEEVSIGRVITTERGKGYGRILLEAGIALAKEKMNADKIKIEAQLYAQGFYEKVGFQRISDEFLEDGILHIHMMLEC